jgi:hypothetical protein
MEQLERLVLHYDMLSTRTHELYRTLENSPTLRQLFIDNPCAVLAERVFPESRLPPSKLDKTNQIFFSLISNRHLMLWADEYQKDMNDRLTVARGDPEKMRAFFLSLDRRKIQGDLAAAILQHGDRELMGAILDDLQEPLNIEPIIWFAWGPLLSAIAVLVVALEAFVVVDVSVALTHETPPPPPPPGDDGDDGPPPPPGDGDGDGDDGDPILARERKAAAYQPAVRPSPFSREDLQRFASIMGSQLLRRAAEHRSSRTKEEK